MLAGGLRRDGPAGRGARRDSRQAGLQRLARVVRAVGPEIRAVGLGELLARLERLRKSLAAEGLFAAERKRPLPFLPGLVGLVCGRDSAAERDVLENAGRRWPAVRFRVEQVPVQGAYAVGEVIAAVQRLDADPEVDVIIIARGGGSIEDLLPFSDEALVRAVAACRTPVVSAIGHEQDTPILDYVADLRASTPTDAAKRVVPDVSEQLALVSQLRDRARRAVSGWLAREESWLAGVRSRPALADPVREIERQADGIDALVARARTCLDSRLARASDDVTHTRARLLALSPASTLKRGYAIVHARRRHRSPLSRRRRRGRGADDPLRRRPPEGRPRRGRLASRAPPHRRPCLARPGPAAAVPHPADSVRSHQPHSFPCALAGRKIA